MLSPIKRRKCRDPIPAVGCCSWHLSCQGDCVSALELDDGANRFYFLVYRAGITLLHMGTFFSVRRFAYKAGQVGSESRNVEREKLIERETRRGQRCAWILGTCIQHISGNKPGMLSNAVMHPTPTTGISTPRGGTAAVRYAALTAFQTDLENEIISTASTLVAHVQKLPTPCLRIFPVV